MIQLYEFAASGNCHKVRMMLSLLDIPYQSIMVNGATREHKSADYLAMNPLGQVPVLVDGDVVLRDSQAILVYLARQYGAEQADFWLPNEPANLAQVVAWLATAANEVTRGPNALRLHHKWGRAIHLAEAETITEQLLTMLNQHLTQSAWLAAAHITIADIAIYPYIALATEGKVDLHGYPAVVAWIKQIQSLHGYVSMAGIDTY
ncbi:MULTISPECIES: glutathione S-transferase family protein [Deefgea]|uniref:Glutathione S-transferase n=1 Tax=Deefgea chitinilytica TaxID=570276 RepID=A0ABS2CAF7_9NEIS|nr:MULTISPECIES: glutathione S-transferase family protein [Deefgea]MBM5571136.1 glutathione S-transferase [Deefgea chitinilytica]MBM9888366.1 glutathione S-transferase family protein [Deefgea sp. CFH1-16]